MQLFFPTERVRLIASTINRRLSRQRFYALEIILLWELEIEMRLLWDVAAKCDRGIDLLYPTQSQIFKILNELHKMVTLNKRKENIQSQHIKGLVTWLRGRHYHSSLPPAIIYFSGPSIIISVSSDDDDWHVYFRVLDDTVRKDYWFQGDAESL